MTRKQAQRRTGVYRSARFSTSVSEGVAWRSLLTTVVLLFGGAILISLSELPVVWGWCLVVLLACALALLFPGRVRPRR